MTISIDHCLSVDTSINDSSWYTKLPIGWQQRFTTLFAELEDVGVTFSNMKIKNGVLYMTISSASKHKEIADTVVKALHIQSAKSCMMCGKHAMRRKEQEHMPPLCVQHYIEYINRN